MPVESSLGREMMPRIFPKTERMSSVETLKKSDSSKTVKGRSSDEMVDIRVTDGVAQARTSDSKLLKHSVVDWITPFNEPLSPPIPKDKKTNRGYNHSRTGWLLCPVDLDWDNPEIRQNLPALESAGVGDKYQWPRFMYQGYEYNPRDKWSGFLRSSILLNAFNQIFVLPRMDVDTGKKAKQPRSSNTSIAQTYSMSSVTVAALAYTTTQVRFSLVTSRVLACKDRVTDSERFYNRLIATLEDARHNRQVAPLLAWWNCQVLSSAHPPPPRQGALIAQIKERRRLIKEGLWDPNSSVSSANPPAPI
ncbi:hypothetical protein NMY22_g6431 [Coprinellus aureogranulatus]|nr:hypothetical protein NMY22_g6431 [Coprinellus aureogranulatus]